MSTRRSLWIVVCLVLQLAPASILAQPDPLPSWNDGPAKQSIVTFVQKVSDSAGPQFVPPEQRIATFDNDGTLWSEQPIYFQFAFALARVKALAPKHPESSKLLGRVVPLRYFAEGYFRDSLVVDLGTVTIPGHTPQIDVLPLAKMVIEFWKLRLEDSPTTTP